MLSEGRGGQLLVDNCQMCLLSRKQWCRSHVSQLLRRLRQEDCLRPGIRLECSEPKLHHCTPAWATEQDSVS
uniref:Uncharacterized protein n=1 Tax=Macaca fascicularis TaxID=9541 RepID=A0A7N9D5Q0_MACFA